MTTAEILARFERVKPVAGGFMCRCPAHQDDTASLSISEGKEGRTVLHCHAGCLPDAVLAAAGLSLADLFPARAQTFAQPTATYDYHDERGERLYQSVRFPADADGKKRFLQRKPNGSGGWIWKMEGVRRVCYHLDKLQGRDVVVVVEGEKDADRLWSLNLPATTNSGGAGKWTEDHTAQLKAAGLKRVVVLSDNDAPGEAHSLMVARSCDDAGLFTKRILLPDLPPKGDVSDWLNAGNNRADLLAIIKNAPPFSGKVSVVVKPKLELTSLADLLAEPDEAVEWLVDERIPGGSLILLAGRPKAGKSTLARALAFCVAAGEPWLGHHVSQGPVWYLALEDKRAEVRAHFRRMGASGCERIWVLTGEAPKDCLALLQERATKEKPALIIVDTLQRLLQAKDLNDYAEVTTRFAPLLKLSRETGAAVVVVHHANKGGEGINAILGSTALSGSVDNIFLLGRGEHDRTLETTQRIGYDLDPTIITLDPDTGHVSVAGSKRDADINRAADQIVAVLTAEPEPRSMSWIRDRIEVKHTVLFATMAMLKRREVIFRVGEGKRGAPYRFGVCGSGGSLDISGGSKNAGIESAKRAKTASAREPVLALQNQQVADFFFAKSDDADESGPVQGTRNAQNPLVLSTCTDLSTIHDEKRNGNGHGSFVVPVVPASFENRAKTLSERSVSDSNDSTYSGSRAFGEPEDVDDSLFSNPEDDNED